MNPYELSQVHQALNTISKIDANSIAEELGIKAGDRLVAINGQEILDLIDYRYYSADEVLTLTILSKEGELWEYHIEKEPWENLGLNFARPLLDRQRTCSNQCLFCFIDQMPPNMRKTLYIKDDDSRLSFLQGNYITLTNMKEEDFQRLIDYRLSPINVSIHTTNSELRQKMLVNRQAGRIMTDLKRLVEAGIQINGQIVLVPGLNDGKELEKTMQDLAGLGENLHSVAIVPVGITKYRDHLPTIEPYTKQEAQEIIELVENFSSDMRINRGRGWVYLSDEFYLIAEEPIPEEKFYDGYPQYENGVGLIRSFYEEAKEALLGVQGDDRKDSMILATGEYAFDLIQDLSNKVLKKFPNLDLNLVKIYNDFFGHTVKVSGLLTGVDLIEKLKGFRSDVIIVPRNMFRSDELITLDDYTIDSLEEHLDCKIIPVENNGESFVKALLKGGREWKNR